MEEERPASPVPDRPVSLDDVEKSLIRAGERVKHRSVSPRPPVSPRSTTPCQMTPKHFHVDNPDLLDISSKPHGIHSLLPPACVVRPLTPKQVVVFPPDFPTVMYSRSPTPRREKKSPDRCTTCPSPLNALVPYQGKEDMTHTKTKTSTEKSLHTTMKKSETFKKETKHAKEHKVEKEAKETLTKEEAMTTKAGLEKDTKVESFIKEGSAKTVEIKHEKTHDEKMFYTKSEVEKLIHEEVLKALGSKESDPIESEPEISVHDLPKPIAPSGWMTTALTTASERPFTPVPFPKPMELPSIAERIIPMVPVEIKKDDKPVPLPTATKPYFPPPPPPPDKEGKDDRTARALREVGCRSPMTEALTVAPKRSYSPLPSYSEAKPTSKPDPASKQAPQKQVSMTSALTIAPSVPFTVPGKTPIPKLPSPGEGAEKNSAFKPVHPKPYVPPEKTEKYGVDMAKIAAQGHTKSTVHSIETGKMCMASFEKKSESHLIPYYQENIGEIPVRNRSISPVPHLIVAPSIKPTPAYIPQPPKPKQETLISKKEEKSESEKAEFLQTKSVTHRSTTPSGLHPPGELPYYQQNIGVIPVRNKAISPAPHLIKAPQLEAHTAMQQGYKSTVYSETKTYSAQKSSTQTSTKNLTNITKETSISGHKSPQLWKLETKRTIQNLSPITVRLQSPRPVTPVQGETEQKAIAKVEIHRPRPSSPLPPTVKVKVDYPPVTSSSTVIGSGKSAFASVKNGTSTQSKKTEHSSEHQKQSYSGSAESGSSKSSSHIQEACQTTASQSQGVCQKTTSQSQEVCQKAPVPCQDLCKGSASQVQETCQKSVCQSEGMSQKSMSQSQEMSQKSVSQSQVCQKSQSQVVSQQMASTVSSSTLKSESSEMREQSSTMQKASHSGITSFRVYGETAKKTVADNSFGLSNKTQELKLQEAKMSKTFEEKNAGKMQISAQSKLVEGSQGISRNVVDQKQGEYTSTCNLASKANFPVKKLAIGGNKSSVDFSPCPLPTFPSLPQLSDVPWTPGAGGAGGRTATFAGSSAPKRGRGILNPSVAPGARIPLCGHCNMQIRGPFITALGKIWCPDHFVCVNGKCRRPLQDIGFVEEPDGLYCEFCYEQYLAPTCDKCHSKIKGDCLNAIGKHFHPECFSCAYCGKLFGNNPFFLEDALPYCEADWNELFTTKCFSCGFPIEAGDRWVEALNNNYHSQCFNCTMCKKNLEGQSFFAKAGRPFCKNHAR